MLFDLDGTLVDSQRDIAAALNEALVEVGRTPLAIDAILPMIGDGARMLAIRALGGEVGLDPDVLARTSAAFLEHYARRPVVHTTLLPGAREALGLGVPSALVTNKPRRISLLVIEQLGIAKAFGAVFAGGDGPLKPSGYGLEKVIRELGARREHTWMIGDGPQDVLAGRAAGCFTVAVLGGIAQRERVLEAKPDRVVGSLHELAQMARDAVTSARP